VIIFDRAGERVFESYGGLDLVHEADLVGAGELTKGHYAMRLKHDPLNDAAAVREGIELAFDPYVPAPEKRQAAAR